MIEIKNLQKTYKTGVVEFKALNGISLKIKKGEFVAIMGHSGSGKSTLLHLLGFLDSPDGGSYKLNNVETSNLSDSEYAEWRKKKIGFVFQQFHLLPRLSVVNNVALPLIYAGYKNMKARALDILKSVGLEDKANNLPNELSGGQRQRVAIARSLINAPEIILADEPTGNLDSQTQKEIMSLFTELHRKGKTVVVVTHEEDVAKYAFRTIHIRDGKILSDKKAGRSSQRIYNEKKNLQTTDSRTKSNRVKFIEHMTQATRSILGNKLRSFLSILGIMIGVGAVIAMLGLGEGAKESIRKSLSSLGSNLLVVRPAARRSGGISLASGSVTRLDFSDVNVIRKIPEVLYVSGDVDGRAQVIAGNKNWNTRIQGADVTYAEIHSVQPKFGRFFTDKEIKTRERVALLGQTVVSELFADKNPIGQNIRINRTVFRVIGILPERGSTRFRDQDDIIVVPLTTAMYRLLGRKYLDSIDVQIKSFELMGQAETEVSKVLMKKYRINSSEDKPFYIRNMADIQNTLQSSTNTMTMLLGFVAAISLVVGGIGIMNIMLVSVTERTREIGLRKAIGAQKKDILTQFIVESVLMTALGGTAGILLGTTISFLISHIAHWTTKVTVESVFLSLFFSVSIGMLFGILPAKKAGELNPIDALRYE